MPLEQANQTPEIHFHHLDAPECVIDAGRLRGLRHRTVIDGSVGAAALALWHEEHSPEFSVPLHRHDCEEVITVLRGQILATVGSQVVTVGTDESILIPAFELHGFEVVSDRPVKLLAIFASPRPQVLRADGTLSPPPWEGGTPAQFDDEEAGA